jgi:hypothetical protein
MVRWEILARVGAAFTIGDASPVSRPLVIGRITDANSTAAQSSR